ncbi:MAG: hypothetical protein ABI614_03725 [Planctomycetota bacterium]
MATCSGSIDPGIVLHVQRHHGLTADQVETLLNRESGLLRVWKTKRCFAKFARCSRLIPRRRFKRSDTMLLRKNVESNSLQSRGMP